MPSKAKAASLLYTGPPLHPLVVKTLQPLSAQNVAGEDTTQVKNTVLLLLLNFINRKISFMVFKEFLVKELQLDLVSKQYCSLQLPEK